VTVTHNSGFDIAVSVAQIKKPLQPGG